MFVLVDDNTDLDEKYVKSNLVQHLSDLQKTFLKYFPILKERLSKSFSQ